MTQPKSLNLNLRLYMALWIVVSMASLMVCLSLPVGTEIPIHWNLEMEPDGYANRWFALSVIPVVSLGVALLFKVLPLLEPRKDNLKKSETAYAAMFWGVQLLMLVIQLSFLNVSWEWGFEMPTFVSLALGLLFIILGNFLGKTRSTFMFGIRTAWTLSSEQVWRKVHRQAGFQFFLLGALLLLTTPWASKLTLPLGLGTMGLILGWATAYSYLLWRKEQRPEPIEKA